MKRKNLSFVVAYLFLVVLPLLVVAGVLRSGRALTAPVSVGGLWRIQDAGNVVPFPCGKSLTAGDVSFTISQSGKSVILDFAGAIMSSTTGTVEGSTITAAIMPSAKWLKETQCEKGRVLILTATVDSKVNAHFLAGVLLVNDCPACASVHFRAVRDEQTKSTGAD